MLSLILISATKKKRKRIVNHYDKSHK